MSDYLSSSTIITEFSIPSEPSCGYKQDTESARHNGESGGASGYLAGDEEWDTSSSELTGNGNAAAAKASGGQAAVGQGAVGAELVPVELNATGVPPAAQILVGDGLDEVADSDIQTGAMGQAPPRVDGPFSDTESTNQGVNDIGDYSDVSSNLKRRRVFTFDRANRRRF